MKKAGYPGHFWPSPLQEEVLRAALLPGDAGRAAWARVRPDLELDDLWDPEIHRLLPLVQRNLQGLEVEDRDLPRLRGLTRRTWYENQTRLHAMRPALERLQTAGIELMLLKGVPLALQYYRDLGLRPMDDIDVLVPTAAAEDALAILEDDGWPVSRRELRIWHGSNLAHPDGRRLDLHWHLGAPFMLPYELHSDDDFWAASLPISVTGLDVRALSPTDQLLHVCVHGSWSVSAAQVRWIADAAVVVREARDRIDWPRFVDQVTRRRLMLPVSNALRYLVQEFEVPIPPSVQAAIDRVPPTPRERGAYRASTREIEGRPMVGGLLATWAYWSQKSARRPRWRAVVGFPAFLRDIWGLDHLWEVPHVTVVKAARKLVEAAGRGASRVSRP